MLFASSKRAASDGPHTPAPRTGKAGCFGFSLVLLLVILGSRPALARSTSFDDLTFKPAPDAGYYLTIYGAQMPGVGRWKAGLLLDYAKDGLVLQTAAGTTVPIVGDLIAGHIFGSYGVLHWFNVGLNIDLAFYEAFTDPMTRLTSHETKMGDVRLNLKFGPLNLDRFSVSLAFVPYLDIPTGAGSRFAGNNSFAGGGKVVLETHRFWDRFSAALNVGYHSRDNVILTGGTRADDLLTYGLGFNGRIVPAVEAIAEVWGGSVAADLFQNSRQSPLEGEIGFRFLFGRERRIQATVGGGGGLVKGIGSPNLRLFAGVTYTPP